MRYLLISLVVMFTIGALPALSYARIDPETVVGMWLFDEGKGDTVKDSSRNGNNGTIFGASWAKGKFNSALEFDGIDDYVDTTEDVGSGSVITVCFWVNPGGTTGSGRNPMVTRWKNDTNDRGFQIRAEGDSRLWTFLSSDGATYSESTSILNFFALNEWQHVAMVFAEGKVTIYRDGENVLDDNVNQEDLNDAATPLAMGRAMNGGTWDYFKGLIDEVAVFETVLTGDEIKTIMNQGLESVVGVSDMSKFTITWAKIKVQD